MDYPILVAGQLAPHLKSLRKAKSLTQAQLGALLGLGQALDLARRLKVRGELFCNQDAIFHFLNIVNWR